MGELRGVPRLRGAPAPGVAGQRPIHGVGIDEDGGLVSRERERRDGENTPLSQTRIGIGVGRSFLLCQQNLVSCGDSLSFMDPFYLTTVSLQSKLQREERF